MPAKPKKRILLTLAEDLAASTAVAFQVLRRVDEYDCLRFAAALQSQGHELFFINWKDVDAGKREVTRAFSSTRGRYVYDIPGTLFDLAFIYKMEGFLLEQDRFLDMVSMFEACCEYVINDPATIRHNIDKNYLFELEARGIPVVPSYWIMPRDTASDSRQASEEHALRERMNALAGALRDSGKGVVLKLLRGERGDGIVRVDARASLGSWLEVSCRIDPQRYFLQEYMPSIRAGERSLAYLGHAFQHAVIKYPNPNDPEEFRCNESLGGSVAPYQPSVGELEVAARTLKVYESLGYPVHFSRIDLIDSPNGPMLMEAELLNPSIYANYLGRGEIFGKAFAEYVSGLWD